MYRDPIFGNGQQTGEIKPAWEKFGFKFGHKGTHTSRTIMFSEISILLNSLPCDAGRSDYLAAITESNALDKPTAATRKLTAQRLTELYTLDPVIPLFRVLLRFWRDDVTGRPLLALLCALARDPLLRATAEPGTGHGARRGTFAPEDDRRDPIGCRRAVE